VSAPGHLHGEVAEVQLGDVWGRGQGLQVGTIEPDADAPVKDADRGGLGAAAPYRRLQLARDADAVWLR
jgi:hypothetical protein